jgi:hypothetical protein
MCESPVATTRPAPIERSPASSTITWRASTRRCAASSSRVPTTHRGSTPVTSQVVSMSTRSPHGVRPWSGTAPRTSSGARSRVVRPRCRPINERSIPASSSGTTATSQRCWPTTSGRVASATCSRSADKMSPSHSRPSHRCCHVCPTACGGRQPSWCSCSSCSSHGPNRRCSAPRSWRRSRPTPTPEAASRRGSAC